eukprot:GHVU01234652.1.p1 GENE.GHVU01234652.1~~GHVU01234652.1.p1  ORF type:complete len:101 (+),score=5.61 GHVU01234652.1:29-304(+)
MDKREGFLQTREHWRDADGRRFQCVAGIAARRHAHTPRGAIMHRQGDARANTHTGHSVRWASTDSETCSRCLIPYSVIHPFMGALVQLCIH